MSSSSVLGKYLWHELVTTDPAAGAGFYSKVFGWTSRPWEGEAEYAMLEHEKGPVGGARVVGKDPLADKVGPNWLTYVGVPDLAAALKTVELNGGRIVHPPTEVAADGGRYAVIEDPQGGTIGIYEPKGHMAEGHSDPMAAPVMWHELTAEDPVAALQFYKTLFDWDVIAEHPMGGEVGTYYLFGKGTTQMGGAFKRIGSLPPTWPHWLVYLGVPGVTETVASSLASGGQLLNGPHPVPGGGWIAQMLDAHGIPLAVTGPEKAAGAAAPAAKVAAKPKAPRKAKPAAAVEATPTAAAKSEPQEKTKSAPAPKAGGAPKSKVKAKAKTAKPKVKAKAKTKTKVKTKTKSPVKAKAKRAPVSKAKTKVKAKAKAKAKSKSKQKAKAPTRKSKAARRKK